MPYCITVAGDIQQCFPDFDSAHSDILRLREQGLKPRLYYSSSFQSLGCEIDDLGMQVRDYTQLSWHNLMSFLPAFDASWSVEDQEPSNMAYRAVDVYVLLCGRTHHFGDMHYPHGEIIPSYLRVNTHLVRVAQGLMDPLEL